MTGVWYNKRKKVWQVTFKRKIYSFITEAEAIAKRKELEAKFPKITPFQILCYKYCSDDFAGLTQVQAAKIMKKHPASVNKALKRLEKKFPILFPLHKIKPKTIPYQSWMDFKVVAKI